MAQSIEEWNILKQHSIDDDDFAEGKCEICHEKARVTSVVLTFQVWVAFDELSKADQETLSEEARKKNERIPAGLNCGLDPLLSGDFCVTCLAKGLLASHLQVNVVNPNGHIATPVKSYFAEDVENE